MCKNTEINQRGRSKSSLIERLGLPYAFVPMVVTPVAITMTSSSCVILVPAVFLAISIVGDALLPPRLLAAAPDDLPMADAWLVLFGASLVVFLFAAGSALNGRSLPVHFMGATTAGANVGEGMWLHAAALAVSAGLLFSLTFNVAHDLIHRADSPWRWWYGYALLMLCGDSQMSLSHVFAHHQSAATSRDAATSRRGESLYRFVWRSAVGQYAEAWAYESSRLRNRGYGGPWCLRNRVLTGFAGTAAVATAAGWLFGLISVGVYLFACLIGKLLFEAANYIQHYGLVRIAGSRMEARHSWDCTAPFTRLFMFNQNHHAHHHLSARQRYWQLLPEPAAPMMPFGYLAMMALASVPPIWFRIMHSRLERWGCESATEEERRLMIAPRDPLQH